MVKEWAVVMAACHLYFARGLLDSDATKNKMEELQKRVDSEISQVRDGTLRLNAKRRWSPNPTCPTSF
jgi:hypothetical protein